MEKVRGLAFRTGLFAALAVYIPLAKGVWQSSASGGYAGTSGFPGGDEFSPTAADDAVNALLNITCGAFVLCTIFFGWALVRAYLEADDRAQLEWEAERDASRAAGAEDD